jgi:protein-disulfide isomerase
MRLTLPLVAALVLGCNAQTAETPAAHAAGKNNKSGTAAAAGSDMDAKVASWDGGSVSYGDLYADVKGQLIRAEVEFLTQKYQTESQALDAKLIEVLLEAEAKKQGLADVETLLEKEIESKVSDPTEEEMLAFYQVMQRQLRGAPYDSVKPQVAAEIIRRKQTEIFQAYMEGLKASYNVKVDLAFPDLPRIPVSVDDDPSMGPEGAPITIVQFAEYQCPYCGKAGEALDQVMEKYGDKVRMVYRDFPLSFHPRAIPAAIAANCAGDQDKYWEMHKLLMSDQRSLEDADLTAHATTLELDLARWNTCREDPAQAAEVQKDFEDGQAAGVSGTPAFFINGVMLSGAQPYSEFERIIERELEAG